MWREIVLKGQNVAWQKLLQLWEEMASSGVRKDAASYHQVISTLISRGQWLRASILFEEMEKTRIPPKTDTIPYAVTAYSRLGYHNRSMKILEKWENMEKAESISQNIQRRIMEDLLLKPEIPLPQTPSPRTPKRDSISARDMRLVVKASRSWKTALTMLKTLGDQPGAYGAVARECAIGSAWATALRLLKECQKRGETYAYEEVMGGFAIAKSLQGSMATFSAARAAGLRLGLSTYSLLLTTCQRARQWLASLNVLNRMDIEGVRRNTKVFSIAMRALAQGRQWRRSLGLFAQMGSIGLRRDHVAFAAAMEACRQGNRQAMEWVEEQMRDDRDEEDPSKLEGFS
uniref:Pentacotripeptide-repeat region of PRORP domain-containing protein n=1 Tax=Amorphochlora amoebiformis TaxID=1561963 RepID=A0A7S0CZJ3_9EUKA